MTFCYGGRPSGGYVSGSGGGGGEALQELIVFVLETGGLPSVVLQVMVKEEPTEAVILSEPESPFVPLHPPLAVQSAIPDPLQERVTGWPPGPASACVGAISPKEKTPARRDSVMLKKSLFIG